MMVILFWISLFGLFLFIYKYSKLAKELIIPFTFIGIILLLFAGAMLNVIKLLALLIFIFGFFSYIWLLYKKYLNREFIKGFFDYKIFIFIGFIILFTLLSFNLHITSYDNFSHWAVIVKQLFLHDSLSSFQYNLDEFTTYPPGSALFIYFVGLIVGKNETSMILGQNYLFLGLVVSLTFFLKDKRKALSTIFYVLFVFVLATIDIAINDLSVDTLLGVLGVVSLVVAYYYRNDLKKATLLLTLVSLFFVILKNSGLLFVVMNCLLLIIIGVRLKRIKQLLLALFIMVGSSFLCFYIWQQHLLMVYPAETGITTKHSISITNFDRTLHQNGKTETIEVVKKYISNFFDVSNNLINWYMVGINVCLLILIFLFKDKRKTILLLLLLVNVLYVGYAMVYCIMYALSMPYAEAIVLASYNRYMFSCIIVLFGILFILSCELSDIHHGNKILIPLSLILFLLIFFNGNNKNYIYFLGDSNYKKTDIYKIKQVAEKYDISKYNDDVAIYMSCDFTSFYNYAFRYEYFKKNINVYCNDINLDTLSKGTIILDVENKIENKKNLKEINDNIYKITKKGD